MADIFYAYAHYNDRAPENVSCWVCQHFQRYDADGSKDWCEGECRKNAPNNNILFFHNPNWRLTDSYFPYMPWGSIAWCSGFQKSLEANIPAPPPGPGKDGCAHQIRDDWVLPPTINDGTEKPIPSKKPLEESCWFCSHFQRRFENPSTTDPNECKGYCQIAPPDSYYRLDPDYQAGKFNYDLNFPLMVFGPLLWCSRWLRTTRDVPPPPQIDGVYCADPP